MKNKEYWAERFRQLEASQHRSSEKLTEDIQRQMSKAEAEIEKKIYAWYGRLAANNGVSMAEARKLLRDRELKEFRWDVEEYIKYGKENALNGQWMKELENASARVHISRLEQLKLQVQQEAEKLYGNYLDGVDRHMKSLYEEGFYKTAYEIQRGVGVGWNLTGVDPARIDKIIRKPWAADGKNFSERIWSSKQQLVDSAHISLTQMCILGQSPDRAIGSMAKSMQTSKNQAGRLIMTESAFFGSEARKDSFQELGVEKYEILATLDSITSQICREMDGKVFSMSEYEAGVTAPPFHVWCRSTTVPAFGDEFDNIGERAARGEDGKTYYVPADMTYPEWKEKYVDKVQAADTSQDKSTADYLVRTHTPGQDISDERRVVDEVISSMPKRVRDALGQGTMIDIGKAGASQYDYDHDIMYIAKGADKTAVIHEIGHVVENKMLDSGQVAVLRKKMVGNVNAFEIVPEIYRDGSQNEVEVFLLKKEHFISDYQGRVYVDSDNIFEAFNKDGSFKDDLLWEFVSEGFAQYVENPEVLKGKCPELFALIEEAVQ